MRRIRWIHRLELADLLDPVTRVGFVLEQRDLVLELVQLWYQDARHYEARNN